MDGATRRFLLRRTVLIAALAAEERPHVPGKSPGSQIKNKKAYEALKRKGMSKTRAARISNAGKAGARRGGRKSAGRKRSSRS